MNKIYIIAILFAFVLFSNLDIIKDKAIEASLFIKEKAIYVSNFIKDRYNFFTNQQKTIENLKKENLILKNKVEKLYSLIGYCTELKHFKDINNSNVVFAKVISFAAIPDFTQIYLDYNKSFKTPRGLIYNNIAVGILIKNLGNYSLGILNANPKTSYSVIIGNKEVPGIFEGKVYRVKYIKKFAPIKIGDIVKTSGLDGIFYKGALVGKVIKIIQKKLYQEVVIKPFFDKLSPYFYVYENKTKNN